MSLDANDLVEGLLDEQSRRNALFIEQPDQNAVIQDLVQVPDPTGLPEIVGGTETLTPTVTTPPHKWDDGTTAWGFFSWA